MQLAAECIGSRLDQAEALLASLADKGDDELPPRIGIDPVFSRRSMYDFEVRERVIVCACSSPQSCHQNSPFTT